MVEIFGSFVVFVFYGSKIKIITRNNSFPSQYYICLFSIKKIGSNWRCECGEDWSHFLWINLEYYFCDQTMLFLFFQMPNGTIRDSVANTLCEFVRTRNHSERSAPLCQLLPTVRRFAERKEMHWPVQRRRQTGARRRRTNVFHNRQNSAMLCARGDH